MQTVLMEVGEGKRPAPRPHSQHNICMPGYAIYLDREQQNENCGCEKPHIEQRFYLFKETVGFLCKLLVLLLAKC